MRALIQNKLEEIEYIECGEIISDDIIEDDITYFGYQVNKNFINSDFEQNYTYRVSITGYVTRRIQANENTTEIIDNISQQIINKLKELNQQKKRQDNNNRSVGSLKDAGGDYEKDDFLAGLLGR